MKHYKEKLSAYLHHELPKDERQLIGEHLLQCADCRKEHDEIKIGVGLASNLQSADAPPMLWENIENALDKKQPAFSFSKDSFFRSQIFVVAASVILICSISFLIYFVLVRQNSRGEYVKQSTQTESIQQIEWSIETISGTPTAGNQPITKNEVLTVGETLETDANSRAKVQIANIGQVEIAPNSRLQLVKTESTEHRLSLEEGSLQARIFAPPRLFIVDTPSAVAVDLGCAYKLEVDKQGNSKLHVTSGFVALESNGRESIVSAGAVALTKKGKGIGTPYFEDVSAQFQRALYKFDFENGAGQSLKIILNEAREKDALTLWHLLSRTNGKDREQVFETLNKLVKLPDSATKAGVLKLDKKMLETWRLEM